jgi:hypothetical protein
MNDDRDRDPITLLTPRTTPVMGALANVSSSHGIFGPPQRLGGLPACRHLASFPDVE